MAVKYIKSKLTDKTIDVIIPAAGFGRRMKCYGPKALIQIDSHNTIISRQLNLIQQFFNINNIILVCGFKATKLMDATPDSIMKIENENFENTNVVRSLGMGLRLVQKDVLIVYGDLVFNESCLKHVDLTKSCMLTGQHLMTKNEVGCVVTQGLVQNMMYGLDDKWGQIAFFTGYELKLLKKMCWSPRNYRLFGFEVINKIINSGGNMHSYSPEDAKVFDIDTIKDLKIIEDVL